MHEHDSAEIVRLGRCRPDSVCRTLRSLTGPGVANIRLHSQPDNYLSVLRFDRLDDGEENGGLDRCLFFYNDGVGGELTVYGELSAEDVDNWRAVRFCMLRSPENRRTTGRPGRDRYWHCFGPCVAGVPMTQTRHLEDRLRLMDLAVRHAGAGDPSVTSVFSPDTESGRSAEIHSRFCTLLLAARHPDLAGRLSHAEGRLERLLVSELCADEWDMFETGIRHMEDARRGGPSTPFLLAGYTRWSAGICDATGSFGRIAILGKAANVFVSFDERFYDAVSAGNEPVSGAIGDALTAALRRELHLTAVPAWRAPKLFFAVGPEDGLTVPGRKCASCGCVCAAGRPALHAGTIFLTWRDIIDITETVVARDFRAVSMMIAQETAGPDGTALSELLRMPTVWTVLSDRIGKLLDLVRVGELLPSSRPVVRRIGWHDGELGVATDMLEESGLDPHCLAEVVPLCLRNILSYSRTKHPKFHQRNLIGPFLAPLLGVHGEPGEQLDSFYAAFGKLFTAHPDPSIARAAAGGTFRSTSYGRSVVGEVTNIFTNRSKHIGLPCGCPYAVRNSLCPFVGGHPALSDEETLAACRQSCDNFFAEKYRSRPRSLIKGPSSYVSSAIAAAAVRPGTTGSTSGPEKRRRQNRL